LEDGLGGSEEQEGLRVILNDPKSHRERLRETYRDQERLSVIEKYSERVLGIC
jgi:hypothetical protein